MLKNFFKIGLRLSPIMIIPWIINPIECFFWNKGPKIQKNKLENRSHIQVLVSNNPCEDRNDLIQLTSIDGYAAAVYDGHGGWQVSQLCSKKLLQKLDEIIKKNRQKFNKDDQLIIQSIQQTFLEIQKEFLQIALLSYAYGFGRAGRAGSCALICVVHNNKVYCGNAGDSLALLVSQDNPMGFTEINRQLNANNPLEQQRLKKLFPLQQDVIICKNQNNKSCYVKGRLQPTRSIGDFRLKFKQFNNPQNFPKEMQYQPPLKTFSEHYITAVPEITIFELNKNHKSLILASDGLWDQLGRQQVAQVFKKTPIDQVPNVLIQKSLQRAALDNKLTVDEIKKLKAGKKRDIHDDITIVVLDLANQIK